MNKLMIDYSDFIKERTKDFTGREWLFAAIDCWLTDPNAPQIFLLTGEPGIGRQASSSLTIMNREVNVYDRRRPISTRRTRL